MKNPIPPRSVLRLAKLWPNARKQGHADGEIWRVGYYSKQDGLDCIWLVNTAGEYRMTSDQEWLYQTFEVLCVTDEDDLYGEKREVLKAMPEEEIRCYSEQTKHEAVQFGEPEGNKSAN